MAPRGDNSKKAAGNARKAQAAVEKQTAKTQEIAAAEDAKWKEGSKANSKADAQAAKAAETARKRAERAEQLAEEEASLPSKPKGAGSKTSQKKSRGLDLSGLDAPSSLSKNALNATGINNALDALSLTSGSAASQKVDRHPERRYKAAYAAFEERRLQDMAEDKSLRRPQKLNQIRKEFEKHPDNPFNQTSASFNASPQEISDIRNQEAEKIEKRLASGK